jgi:uroporphyrinogen decarboxylase
MNCRERFNATVGFGRPDRAFLLPPWCWHATTLRWQKEGLPENVDWCQYFGTDDADGSPVVTQGRYGPHLWPPLERVVLSETADHIIVRDEEGNTVKLMRSDTQASMPEWLAYPMKDRHDWETIVKPRMSAKVPGRCPQGKELEEYAAQVRGHEKPLGIWTGSFYGWPRSLMGVETVSVMFYDDPGLIHEMCQHIADFVIETITPILKVVEFDLAHIWEDMAGKAGPLCSPAMYREFCMGPLKRVTDVLHRHGVHHIIVDSDGNNDLLIPLWLEAGVTGLRPFEIAAGSDPVATRRKYGKDLIIEGGIDKRALARTREDIDREVLSKVPWLCLQGGFLPQVDHLVPPDVSLENYTYYSRLLRAVVEDPERYLHEARTRGFWKD